MRIGEFKQNIGKMLNDKKRYEKIKKNKPNQIIINDNIFQQKLSKRNSNK